MQVMGGRPGGTERACTSEGLGPADPAAAVRPVTDLRARGVLTLAQRVIGELDIDAVLERTLESARELTGAQYAALGVLDEGRMQLSRFVTSGVDDRSRVSDRGAADRARGARRAHPESDAGAGRRRGNPSALLRLSVRPSADELVPRRPGAHLGRAVRKPVSDQQAWRWGLQPGGRGRDGPARAVRRAGDRPRAAIHGLRGAPPGPAEHRRGARDDDPDRPCAGRADRAAGDPRPRGQARTRTRGRPGARDRAEARGRGRDRRRRGPGARSRGRPARRSRGRPGRKGASIGHARASRGRARPVARSSSARSSSAAWD